MIGFALLKRAFCTANKPKAQFKPINYNAFTFDVINHYD